MVTVWLNKGIHEFSFPFVGYANNVRTANVKVIIGSDVSINKDSGFLFSVVITQDQEGPHLEHFIENICTQLKHWLEAHLTEEIRPELIRWYQVLPYYNNAVWKLVSMDWNGKSFHSAKWKELQPLTL